MAKKKDEQITAEEKKQTISANIVSCSGLQAENEIIKSQNDVLNSENCELRTLLEKSGNPEYLVVIPYKKSEAQGNELLLAITGWLKHFKERFRLIIIGDHEEFLGEMEEIIHIPHDYSSDVAQLDIISKLMSVVSTYPEYEGLVLTNDDIYPVNDFDITEVKLLKTDGLLTDKKLTGVYYSEIRKRTLDLLLKTDKKLFDYDCHTPVFFETEKLMYLIDKFGLVTEPYLLSSLYFNYFFPTRVPLKLDIIQDNLKVGVYRKNADLQKLQVFIPLKIWVNNSTEGWTSEFQKIMEKIMF